MDRKIRRARNRETRYHVQVARQALSLAHNIPHIFIREMNAEIDATFRLSWDAGDYLYDHSLSAEKPWRRKMIGRDLAKLFASDFRRQWSLRDLARTWRNDGPVYHIDLHYLRPYIRCICAQYWY